MLLNQSTSGHLGDRSRNGTIVIAWQNQGQLKNLCNPGMLVFI
jgi:hypothetical protein